MAVYVEKATWASTNFKHKKVELKQNEKNGTLSIVLKDGMFTGKFGVELYNGLETRRQIREVAKHIIDHFGLSLAELNKVAGDIRRFVTYSR